ncbi:sigma-54-dependent transcriptional regulator [Pedobacter alluvionis]|uniref:Sigma-54-dependent Fis family transcriptional regulator n=1 Tax=Pedobacter alluvionis TaxID=475253 RepID=A0A497XXR6_9SPHI|nr:sigma-54 dependent transcriptional regulator [Pedobacter alluvionis]RLJ73752.1 two-component system response regulator HydG [Pedobacter alluvionis]TFB32632.1 sigma-54-dependent Fis family transcriptional regulator [Pedobacter alluvionis]
MKKKILIVDDEISLGLLLYKFLTKKGFHVSNVTTGKKALQALEKERFDLVLCDYRLDDTDGKEILIHLKENYPNTGVIIITGYSDIKLAVELIKLGAYDYIVKPLYPDEILNTINKALETHGTLKSPKNFESISGNVISDALNCPEYINGESNASALLLKQIQLIAKTGYTVILTGKSGTGKECVAKTIHLNSSRSEKPFIAMDCGSLTKDLAASEFFGHEKGAFTGAAFTKIGHFEQANGGTLFLDEIGNLSYEIQATLLRAVQERKIKRIGSTKEIDLDVRLIVATNENLEEAILKGAFREDLYHRFNEFSIHVPSLKHRDNDILIFARHFLATVNKELNKNIKGFSDEVKKCLLAYNWPGNVRELKNVIRRIALLTDGDCIETHVLPLELGRTDYAKTPHEKKAPFLPLTLNHDQALNLRNAAKEAEYSAILEVLKAVNFNKTKAAKILNIDRKTLYNKIRFIEIGDGQ